MKSNTKPSITLPKNELKLVESLMKRTGAKTKVDMSAIYFFLFLISVG